MESGGGEAYKVCISHLTGLTFVFLMLCFRGNCHLLNIVKKSLTKKYGTDFLFDSVAWYVKKLIEQVKS